MKKNFLNRYFFVLIVLFLGTTVNAQTQSSVQSTIDYKDGDKYYKMKIKDDKIVELYIDDKKIASEDYNKYQETIDRILIKVKKEKEMAEMDRQQAMIAKQKAEMNQEQSGLMKEQSKEDAIQAQKYKAQAELMKEQSKMSQDQRNQMKQQAEQNALQMQKFKQDAEANQQKALADMQHSKKEMTRAKLEAEKAQEDAKLAEQDKQTVDNLLSDLVKEKIVDDEKKVSSVELTEDVFTVNGVKQSDELLKKFKSIYLKKKGTKVNYNYRKVSISNQDK